MTATVQDKLSRNIEKRNEQLRERFAAAGFTLLHASPASKNSNPARYSLHFALPERERWDLLVGHLQYHNLCVYGPEKLEALTADPVLLARVCGLKRHQTYKAALDLLHRPSGWTTTVSKELSNAKDGFGKAEADVFVLMMGLGTTTASMAQAVKDREGAEATLVAAVTLAKEMAAQVFAVAPDPEVPEDAWGEVYDYLRGY